MFKAIRSVLLISFSVWFSLPSLAELKTGDTVYAQYHVAPEPAFPDGIQNYFGHVIQVHADGTSDVFWDYLNYSPIQSLQHPNTIDLVPMVKSCVPGEEKNCTSSRVGWMERHSVQLSWSESAWSAEKDVFNYSWVARVFQKDPSSPAIYQFYSNDPKDLSKFFDMWQYWTPNTHENFWLTKANCTPNGLCLGDDVFAYQGTSRVDGNVRQIFTQHGKYYVEILDSKSRFGYQGTLWPSRTVRKTKVERYAH